MATPYDVIKWKHYPRNWPFVRGIHPSPVNFPHKGQWGGYVFVNLRLNNGSVNNQDPAIQDVNALIMTSLQCFNMYMVKSPAKMICEHGYSRILLPLHKSHLWDNKNPTHHQKLFSCDSDLTHDDYTRVVYGKMKIELFTKKHFPGILI